MEETKVTQDEILEALHKVVQENKHYTTWTVSTPHLVALVNLAIEHEREACAKVCDAFQARDVGMQPAECAGAIRARGQA
jgi:hypothetical protein